MGSRSASSGTFRDDVFTRRAIRNAEDKIRNKDVEHIAVVGKDGKVIYEGKGTDSTHVQIPKEYRSQLRGTDVTHNHPSGNTFSAEDLKQFGKYELNSLRAAGPNGTYVIAQAKTLGQKMFQSNMKLYNDYKAYSTNLKAELHAELQGYAKDVKMGRMTKAEYDDAKAYLAQCWDKERHQWLKSNQSKYGYTYKKERA